MTADLVTTLSHDLYAALRQRRPIPLLSVRHPQLNIEDAYAISLGVLGQRLTAGERLTGKKIGLTAKAVQQMVGVDEPDFGFLTDVMAVPNGTTLTIASSLLAPMVEAEIALVMKADLPTAGVTPEMVLAAADYAVPSLEVVDTRFDTPRLGIVDTVADNASSGFYVLGDARVDPRGIDLAAVPCTLWRNGEPLSQGVGAAVLGSPLNSVAWLANRLGDFGVAIKAGDVVLPGSLVPLAPITAGDRFVAEFTGLGRVSVGFA